MCTNIESLCYTPESHVMCQLYLKKKKKKEKVDINILVLCRISFLFVFLKYFTGSNRFCEDWMHAFLNGAEGGNPFLFRQVLENFKLKVTNWLCQVPRIIFEFD